MKKILFTTYVIIAINMLWLPLVSPAYHFVIENNSNQSVYMQVTKNNLGHLKSKDCAGQLHTAPDKVCMITPDNQILVKTDHSHDSHTGYGQTDVLFYLMSNTNHLCFLHVKTDSTERTLRKITKNYDSGCNYYTIEVTKDLTIVNVLNVPIKN